MIQHYFYKQKLYLCHTPPCCYTVINRNENDDTTTQHSQQVILHLQILRWLIFTKFCHFTDTNSHLFHFSGRLIIEEPFGEQNGTLNFICNIKAMSMKEQTLKRTCSEVLAHMLQKSFLVMESWGQLGRVSYVQLEMKTAEIYRSVARKMLSNSDLWPSLKKQGLLEGGKQGKMSDYNQDEVTFIFLAVFKELEFYFQGWWDH